MTDTRRLALLTMLRLHSPLQPVERRSRGLPLGLEQVDDAGKGINGIIHLLSLAWNLIPVLSSTG
jgi:hypothetical protein